MFSHGPDEDCGISYLNWGIWSNPERHNAHLKKKKISLFLGQRGRQTRGDQNLWEWTLYVAQLVTWAEWIPTGKLFPLGLMPANIGNILATWGYPWLYTYQLLTMHLATCWQPRAPICIKLNCVPALNNGNKLLLLATLNNVPFLFKHILEHF